MISYIQTATELKQLEPSSLKHHGWVKFTAGQWTRNGICTRFRKGNIYSAEGKI